MSSNPIFSYTHRDYEGSRKEGLARIPILSGGKWTDLNASDPGVIILDYAHAIADMLSYYQDHQAMETFLTTAKERANIFRLAKQLSYKILSAKGATAIVTFYLPVNSPVLTNTIRIPRHTSVSTSSGINYLTVEDAYIRANETSVDVECYQGVLYEMTYTGTGISRYSDVEGAKNQEIHIPTNNIDINSVTIVESKGTDAEVTWSTVDYIVFSNSNDKVYQVDLNPDDTITIKFGDGLRGFLPREVDKLTIQYIVTDAESGRVGAGELINISTPIHDKGEYIELLVKNIKPSSGGSRIQSSSDIRDLAPGAVKAQDRAVTLSDFENLAKLVPGVAGAKAYDINLNPDLCLYHEVKVLIIPEDISGDNSVLLNKVREYLLARIIPPTNLQVFTPSQTAINLEVRVQKFENASDVRIEYMVDYRIREYFKKTPPVVGERFYSSDLYTELQGIEGVRKILNISPASVDVDSLSVATLGNISVIFE